MSAEIYFAPTKTAQRLPLQEVAMRLSRAGLACRIEPEGDDMAWLVFELNESTLMASVEDGAFVFGTLNWSPKDAPNVAEIIDQVMRSIGFSSDEDADYEGS